MIDQKYFQRKFSVSNIIALQQPMINKKSFADLYL